MADSQTLVIPDRATFKAAEVCELLKVQPYVLRTWEAEFPELGVAKSPGAARTYRREDVERVQRIKHLLLIEGLTLAGARRRMEEEATGPAVPPPAHVAHGATGAAQALGADGDHALVTALAARDEQIQTLQTHLRQVRHDLHALRASLSTSLVRSTEFALEAVAAPVDDVGGRPLKMAHVQKSTRRGGSPRPKRSS